MTPVDRCIQSEPMQHINRLTATVRRTAFGMPNRAGRSRRAPSVGAVGVDAARFDRMMLACSGGSPPCLPTACRSVHEVGHRAVVLNQRRCSAHVEPNP